MPQTNHLAVNSKHLYCNDIILTLVRNCLVAESYARTISAAQFESSALSEHFVLSLVYQKKMSVIRALSIKLENYLKSALSSRYMQSLVELSIISVDRALSMHRDEVENPVDYLTALGNKRTAVQNRKLFLYESDLTITPNYVEHIVSLEFKKGGRSEIDDRELALLHDPGLRRYAVYIVGLEYFTEKTPQTARELALIFSHYARPYFDLILDLEYKENKSADDEIHLESLYLRVCCKLPRKNPIFSLFQSRLNDDAGPQGCHEQVYNGGFYSGLIQHDESERKLVEKMKAIFHGAAKEIVMTQLEGRGGPGKLRETQSMQTYILDKTDIVRLSLIKYFVGHYSPYSKECLDALKEKVIQKIVSKDLTLSQMDRLQSLRDWIDEGAQAVGLKCPVE